MVTRFHICTVYGTERNTFLMQIKGSIIIWSQCPISVTITNSWLLSLFIFFFFSLRASTSIAPLTCNFLPQSLHLQKTPLTFSVLVLSLILRETSAFWTGLNQRPYLSWCCDSLSLDMRMFTPRVHQSVAAEGEHKDGAAWHQLWTFAYCFQQLTTLTNGNKIKLIRHMALCFPRLKDPDF